MLKKNILKTSPAASAQTTGHRKEIEVPPARPQEKYQITLLGKNYSFTGLKQLLAIADWSKAGDRNAKIATRDEKEREAARTILSSLSLQHFYENPLTTTEDTKNNIDTVMQANYDINHAIFPSLQHKTLGELKNELLQAHSAEISSIGSALTGVMAAALAKIMDVHELIFISQKIEKITKARTTLGKKGTLSSRLQPNHPTDDLESIRFLSYVGFSLAAGDALIGVNPAIDTVDHVSSILAELRAIREEHSVPTQICVLAHIKTQLQCLSQGAPVEILFQSLAGTQDANEKEFDISLSLLDDAYFCGKEKGAFPHAQFTYFETGQGSEYTYQKHHGIDMTTLEALCYGLARRYDPFMVNNVTGFIGPETHANSYEMILSNLQDHFMGKLLGLPMGMAPCYTLHSEISLEGQQIATQLLASAGATYYMDVALNTDRMLAYFDTSAHDNQTLREIHQRTPTAEYLIWALEREILEKTPTGEIRRGKNWSKPEVFCHAKRQWATLQKTTSDWYGCETAGPRPMNSVTRQVRANQAFARGAIYTDLDPNLLNSLADFLWLETNAHSKEHHLHDPTLGSKLTLSSKEKLAQQKNKLQILVSDGLSAEAVHKNLPSLLPLFLEGLKKKWGEIDRPIVAPYGRVKLIEDIFGATKAEIAVLLIGERPGGNAHSATSLSAYLAFNPTAGLTEYSVISNIYSAGLPPTEAAAVVLEKILQIKTYQAAGNRLEEILNLNSFSGLSLAQ